MTAGSDMNKSEDPTAGLSDVSLDLVMILCTARSRGLGVQRLPNREDRGRQVAAVQVETADQAADVLSVMDRPGRHFYLDVERKQDLDLMGVAQQVVQHGTVSATKPNDTTVDALMATLRHHLGHDHRDQRVNIVGTGNLAFKFALRLAEEGADVALCGRNTEKARLLASAINAVLPHFTPHEVRHGPHLSDIEVLVAAVTAPGVVTGAWLDRLAPHAMCIDVGIGNFTPELIEGAHSRGHAVCRLDVRAAGDPLPQQPNTFFRAVWGEKRVDGVHLVAGGILGKRGDVVVDRVPSPTAVVGIADGAGGVLPVRQLSPDLLTRLERVTSSVLDDREGACTPDEPVA